MQKGGGVIALGEEDVTYLLEVLVPLCEASLRYSASKNDAPGLQR